MRVDNINTTNFNAKLIKQVSVQKLDETDKMYHPVTVSFVEIERNNISDVMAVDWAAKYWENERYASNIASCAQRIFMRDEKFANKKIYALTSQEKGFASLDDTKILGLAEVSKCKNDSIELDYLQVKPAIVYRHINHGYKYVGSRMLDMIKQIYKDKTIFLTSVRDAVDFYTKNGFKQIEKNSNKMVWKSKDIINECKFKTFLLKLLKG